MPAGLLHAQRAPGGAPARECARERARARRRMEHERSARQARRARIRTHACMSCHLWLYHFVPRDNALATCTPRSAVLTLSPEPFTRACVCCFRCKREYYLLSPSAPLFVALSPSQWLLQLQSPPSPLLWIPHHPNHPSISSQTTRWSPPPPASPGVCRRPLLAARRKSTFRRGR